MNSYKIWLNEENLISGREALHAVADGEEVFWKDQIRDTVHSFKDNPPNLTITLCPDCSYLFWIKPKTILINNIEVPAPFKPKIGDSYWFITTTSACGYIRCAKYNATDDDLIFMQFGAWRTEEEIKQVVAAHRKAYEVQP